jgi:hypothetical protein
MYWLVNSIKLFVAQNFEVIGNKFNLVGTCTSENYVQKWIIKLCYLIVSSDVQLRLHILWVMDKTMPFFYK